MSKKSSLEDYYSHTNMGMFKIEVVYKQNYEVLHIQYRTDCFIKINKMKKTFASCY